MGFDPATMMAIATAVQAGSSIWGAVNQNNTNSANQNAVNQRNQQLQGYVNPMLQQNQGQNPYAQALMQFIGRPGLGARQPYALPGPSGGGSYTPGSSGGGGVSPGSGNSGDRPQGPTDMPPTDGYQMDRMAGASFSPMVTRVGPGTGTTSYFDENGQLQMYGEQPPTQSYGGGLHMDQPPSYGGVVQGGPGSWFGGGDPLPSGNMIGPDGQPIYTATDRIGGGRFGPGTTIGPYVPPNTTQPIPSDGGMYRYNDPGDNAFTYTPPTLGSAPMAAGLQGNNAGQDALLQMMRRDVTPSRDPTLDLNLQQIGQGDTNFNNSDLFKSLEPLDQRLIDQNVSQLRAGAGSLGQRFGTAMAQNEGKLREQLGQDVLARNAQLASSSYENAQNRRLQGLGISAGREQNFNQFGLQNAQLQQNAAGQAASSLQGNEQLNLQARLANQAVLAQYGIHGADIANQAGQFNAQQRQAQNQFAAGQGNTYNQLMMNAFGQGNAYQQGQDQQSINLISLLAGLPIGGQQPNALPGAIGDAGSMMMLLPFLQQMMRGRTSPPVSTGTPVYNTPYWNT